MASHDKGSRRLAKVIQLYPPRDPSIDEIADKVIDAIQADIKQEQRRQNIIFWTAFSFGFAASSAALLCRWFGVF